MQIGDLFHPEYGGGQPILLALQPTAQSLSKQQFFLAVLLFGSTSALKMLHFIRIMRAGKALQKGPLTFLKYLLLRFVELLATQ